MVCRWAIVFDLGMTSSQNEQRLGLALVRCIRRTPLFIRYHVLWESSYSLESTIRCPDVSLMLDQRRRRWANIKPTSAQLSVFRRDGHHPACSGPVVFFGRTEFFNTMHCTWVNSDR